MSPAGLSHVERRQILMSQHDRLRTVIHDVRQVAEWLLRREDTRGDTTELRQQIGALRLEMEAHLASEEALLGPILERIDAWGPVRLELLRAEHAHQRAILELLRSDRAAALPPLDLGRRAVTLADDLLADMASEERELLDPNVLTDDVFHYDASDA